MGQRKIGTLPLTCMMVGAVLGSGVIILPPLVIEAVGDWALAGWTAISLFGVAFAYVFAHVGVRIPGEGGAASAVERAFGPSAKRLAAAALCGAVLFGPVAVILTIVEYLPPPLQPETIVGRTMVGAAIQVVCALLVTSGLRNMSRFTLVLAVSATGLLLAGACSALFFQAAAPAPLPPFDADAMGYAMLLLFWAVVGWEVVGNYGAEVEDPRRTVPRAAVLAAVIIGLVSVAVAAALQYGRFAPDSGHGVTVLLTPLFGSAAPWIMGALTLCLCVTTYLVIVGAVSRLLAHLSRESGLPDALARRNRFGVPWVAVAAYTLVHLILFGLVAVEAADLALLVAVSDGFFLANALLGTAAAVRLFDQPLPRLTASALCLGVLFVLLQSHSAVLLAILALAAVIFFRGGTVRGEAAR